MPIYVAVRQRIAEFDCRDFYQVEVTATNRRRSAASSAGELTIPPAFPRVATNTIADGLQLTTRSADVGFITVHWHLHLSLAQVIKRIRRELS